MLKCGYDVMAKYVAENSSLSTTLRSSVDVCLPRHATYNNQSNVDCDHGTSSTKDAETADWIALSN